MENGYEIFAEEIEMIPMLLSEIPKSQLKING